MDKYKTAIVVQACDKYDWCWEGFYRFFIKHFNQSVNWPVYFYTEEKSFDKKEFINLKTGKKSYTENFNFIARSLDFDYLLYFTEETWIRYKLEDELFSKGLQFCYDEDVDRIGYHSINPQGSIDTKKTINDHKIYRIINTHKFGNVIDPGEPSFWKRDFMIKTSIVPMSIWEFDHHHNNHDLRKREEYPKIYTVDMGEPFGWFYPVASKGKPNEYYYTMIKDI